MSAPISIDIDGKSFAEQIRAAEKVFAKIGAQHVPRAAAAAINKTSDRASTRVRRELARAKSLPVGTLKKTVARFHAVPARLVARVWIGLKRVIHIDQLPGARYTFKGELRAGKVRAAVFRAKMPSGKTGLFTRREPSVRQSAGRAGTSNNLPIERPRIRLQPQAERILRSVVAAETRDYLPREFARILNLTLQTLRAARGR